MLRLLFHFSRSFPGNEQCVAPWPPVFQHCWRNVAVFRRQRAARAPGTVPHLAAFQRRVPEPISRPGRRRRRRGRGGRLFIRVSGGGGGGGAAPVADQYPVQTALSWLPTRRDAAERRRLERRRPARCEHFSATKLRAIGGGGGGGGGGGERGGERREEFPERGGVGTDDEPNS